MSPKRDLDIKYNDTCSKKISHPYTYVVKRMSIQICHRMSVLSLSYPDKTWGGNPHVFKPNAK